MISDFDIPAWVPHSSPAPGCPLVPGVERIAVRLRELSVEIDPIARNVDFDGHYAPSRDGLGYVPMSGAETDRAAWALIGEWICASVVMSEPPGDGLAGAHKWFWRDGPCTCNTTFPSTPIRLTGAESAPQLRALAPYLLDPAPAATRRDALRKPADVLAHRHRRKASGVYYTPGDVAWLMAESVAEGVDPRTRWLDPASGAGVFLRAALSLLDGLGQPFDAASVPLYGIDVSPQAAEAAAFVLAIEILLRSDSSVPPWRAWSMARSRLATRDSLLLKGLQPAGDPEREVSDGTPAPPLDREWSNREASGARATWWLAEAFPELAQGVHRVISNPPYAALGSRKDSEVVRALHPATGTSTRDVSPMFVEISMDLLGQSGAMSVVLPLSAVVSTQRAFVGLRRRLVDRFDCVAMSSFDRAPDALFGDDVKTRNSIITASGDKSGGLSASPLVRWTSRNRWDALTHIPLVAIGDLPDVPEVVPKIGTTEEVTLYDRYRTHPRVLSHWIVESQSVPLGLLGRGQPNRDASVAVASTAYNFVGALRDPTAALDEGHSSESDYLVLQFASREHAAAGYAILSSRLAMWVWQATGDGFHVSKRFVENLAVPSDNATEFQTLASLGERLWAEAVRRPVKSVNRGKVTVAFPPSSHEQIVRSVDTECLRVLGTEGSSAFLTEWYRHRVVVHDEPERLAKVWKREA